MSDAVHDDERFERELRDALADLAPAAVPAHVRQAILRVPREAPARRAMPAWRRTRSLLAGLAAATTTLLVIAGLVVLAAHPFGIGRPVVQPGSGTLSPSPGVSVSGSPGSAVRDEYQVLPGGTAPTNDDLVVIASIVTNRLHAMGVASPDVGIVAPDRITVMLPNADPDTVDALRAIIGTTGRVDFVPLGTSSLAPGTTLPVETLARTCPTVDTTSCVLFSGDQIADASAGADQTGNPGLDLVLKPGGAARLADYSAAHVGDSFALVLDGKVVVTPVVQEAITDGRLTIGLGPTGAGGVRDAQRLAALLRYGALPFPLSEVAFGP